MLKLKKPAEVLKVPLRPSQCAWLYKRSYFGGLCFVCCGVLNGLVIFRGSLVLRLFEGLPWEEAKAAADYWSLDELNWDEIARVFRTRNTGNLHLVK
jgi:hypothetical protein